MPQAAEHSILISPDGVIQFIYDDALAPLLACGQAEVRRASVVEPVPAGGWCADMSPCGGEMLGPFPLRGDALKAEVDWLEEQMAGGQA